MAALACAFGLSSGGIGEAVEAVDALDSYGKGVDSFNHQTPSTLALPLTILERRLHLPEAENQATDCQNQNENSV